MIEFALYLSIGFLFGFVVASSYRPSPTRLLAENEELRQRVSDLKLEAEVANEMVDILVKCTTLKKEGE